MLPLKVFASPRRVDEAAKIVMSVEPLNATPLMFREFCKMVAVEALPVSAPTTPPLALIAPPTLSTEEMVVEPVTANAVVVAPAKVAPPLKAMLVVVAFDGNR